MTRDLTDDEKRRGAEWLAANPGRGLGSNRTRETPEATGDLPVAVWEGSLFGIRVYVLSDGRRIVNAEDVQRLLSGDIDFDLTDFGEAFAKFMRGETPNGGVPGG